MFGPPDVKKLAAKGKVEPLVRALTHPYESIQRDAATALGELRDPRAIEPLAAASRDDRLAVRDAAVWALGHIGDPAVIPTLLTHLREGNDRAACALTAIGRPAVGPLLDSSPQTPRARWASRSRRWARSATHGRPPRSRRSWAPPRPGPHGPTTRSCRWVSPPSSTCSRCCGPPLPSHVGVRVRRRPPERRGRPVQASVLRGTATDGAAPVGSPRESCARRVGLRRTDQWMMWSYCHVSGVSPVGP